MVSEFTSKVHEISHDGNKRCMFGFSEWQGRAFPSLAFSWDVGDEHVLIERDRLQITKNQGMLLRPFSLEELMALGIGVAAYIVFCEVRNRKL